VDRARNERVGQFGFFETINDYAVAEKLLATARAWLRARGMTTLRGPLDFTRAHSCGLLISGNDHPPSVLTNYNPPYYAEFCERFGLSKAVDAFAYRLDVSQFKLVDAAQTPLVQIAQRAAQHSRVTIRSARRESFRQDLARALPVYNQSFAGNWDFVPMHAAEFARFTAQLEQIADPDLAVCAEANGEMIGVAIALPDFNQILKHLNGRLFPRGWFTALRLRRARAITQARFLMIGVLENYRQQGIEARLFLRVLHAAIRKGYRTFEFAAILENNDRVNRLLAFWGQPYGIRVVRVYRTYEMEI
jgi:GNAT superfamily N-acetyltransferase